MSKKYLVWKDPACDGNNIEWVELTGKEFFLLVHDTDSQSRHFIRLTGDKDDDTIFIEATQEQYGDWRKEFDAHRNCMKPSTKRKGKGQSVVSAQNAADRARATYKKVSMDTPIQGGDVDSYHEMIADDSVNVEEAVLDRMDYEILTAAVETLTDEETFILAAIFMLRMSTKALGEHLGVSQPTAYRRLTSVLSKLRAFFMQQ